MICRAKISDAEAIAKMAVIMWGSNIVEGLKKDFEELIEGDESVIFYETVNNEMAGFAQNLQAIVSWRMRIVLGST